MADEKKIEVVRLVTQSGAPSLDAEPVVSSCCSASAQSTCCAPSEKSSCCGDTSASGSCGCQ